MPAVLLIGTLDTKGEECAYVRDRLRAHGCAVLTVDVGVLGRPSYGADVTRERVADAAGTDLATLARGGDRGHAIEAMGRGAAAVVRERRGSFEAVIALGGSGGASVAARAFAELPLGFPKLLVSTVAAGN